MVQKVNTCQFVSTIIGVREESARVRDNYIDQAAKKYNEMVEAAKKGQDDGDVPVGPGPEPVVPAKKIKSVTVANLLGSQRKIETKEDVETVVDSIRKQLMDLLDDETILNLK